MALPPFYIILLMEIIASRTVDDKRAADRKRQKNPRRILFIGVRRGKMIRKFLSCGSRPREKGR
jgi:hypothetical protein